MLYECETETIHLERQLEVQRLKKISKIYERRRQCVMNIDKFWYVVLSQHEDFAEYIKPVEYGYFEYLKDLYVTWEVAEMDSGKEQKQQEGEDHKKKIENPGNFSVTFVFDNEGNVNTVESQTITKKFWSIPNEQENSKDLNGVDAFDQETRLVSEKVDVKWPKELLTASDLEKRKSFFSLFKWTGKEKDDFNKSKTKVKGEEVVDEFDDHEYKKKTRGTLLEVEDLINLFVEDIFPNAVKYYAATQHDSLQEELEDDEESEPELEIVVDEEEEDEEEEGNNKKRRKI